MTRLAFGAKVRQAGQAAGCGSRRWFAAASLIAASSDARAAVPMPPAVRPKMCGVTSNRASRGFIDAAGASAHSLVIVSSRFKIMLASRGPGGQLRRVELCARAAIRPTCEQFRRGCRGVAANSPGAARSRPGSARQLRSAGVRGQCQANRNADRARLGVAPPSAQHALGQPAGGFHVGRIVHQHQGLQRRVGAHSADQARFAIRGVERRSCSGGGQVRFQNVYMLRRYRPSPWSCCILPAVDRHVLP